MSARIVAVGIVSLGLLGSIPAAASPTAGSHTRRHLCPPLPVPDKPAAKVHLKSDKPYPSTYLRVGETVKVIIDEGSGQASEPLAVGRRNVICQATRPKPGSRRVVLFVARHAGHAKVEGEAKVTPPLGAALEFAKIVVTRR